jgi:hypothetical protein
LIGEDETQAWCNDRFEESNFNKQFCKEENTVALEKCCVCGGGVQEEIVDTALCRYFSEDFEESWWESDWTELNRTAFQQYQEEIKVLTHRKLQQQWCDEPASDRWGINKDTMTFKNAVEWSDYNKARDLRPTYYFNGASTMVALVSFLLWLSASPHRALQAKHLDKTCTLPHTSVFPHYTSRHLLFYLAWASIDSSLCFFLFHCVPSLRKIKTGSGKLFCIAISGRHHLRNAVNVLQL